MINKDNLRIIKTTVLDEQEKIQLFDLWNSEYPEKLSYRDLIEFNEYLQKLNGFAHLLLIVEKNTIEGWAFSFDRDNERWFAIILSEKIQGQGLGRKMLDKLKKSENHLSGWVIEHNNDKKTNGESYYSPLGFYQKCDFEILKKERLELDKISAVKIKWTKNK